MRRLRTRTHAISRLISLARAAARQANGVARERAWHVWWARVEAHAADVRVTAVARSHRIGGRRPHMHYWRATAAAQRASLAVRSASLASWRLRCFRRLWRGILVPLQLHADLTTSLDHQLVRAWRRLRGCCLRLRTLRSAHWAGQATTRRLTGACIQWRLALDIEAICTLHLVTGHDWWRRQEASRVLAALRAKVAHHSHARGLTCRAEDHERQTRQAKVWPLLVRGMRETAKAAQANQARAALTSPERRVARAAACLRCTKRRVQACVRRWVKFAERRRRYAEWHAAMRNSLG